MNCVPYSHTNIFTDFYLLMLLFFLLCHSDEKGRGQQKKNGQQLGFNCLCLRVAYSNQAVWETWMDRCMLGDSTGLQSEAYCELCPHTESHTVCPSHKQIALRPQPLLFDENRKHYWMSEADPIVPPHFHGVILLLIWSFYTIKAFELECVTDKQEENATCSDTKCSDQNFGHRSWHIFTTDTLENKQNTQKVLGTTPPVK